MIFQNRQSAARLLLNQLKKYQKEQPLILAIPRGAVPMGRVIADGLNCDLDVVLVRKIGAPGNPEFAIGSIVESGEIYMNPAASLYNFSDQYIKDTARKELDTITHRREQYTPFQKPIDPKGRTVIIIDDGIATGSTMIGAIHALRAQQVNRIVVAAPVASQEALYLLEKEADELIILDVPDILFAISQFYEDFPQVTDDEVTRLLSHGMQTAA